MAPCYVFNSSEPELWADCCEDFGVAGKPWWFYYALTVPIEFVLIAIEVRDAGSVGEAKKPLELAIFTALTLASFALIVGRVLTADGAAECTSFWECYTGVVFLMNNSAAVLTGITASMRVVVKQAFASVAYLSASLLLWPRYALPLRLAGGSAHDFGEPIELQYREFDGVMRAITGDDMSGVRVRPEHAVAGGVLLLAGGLTHVVPGVVIYAPVLVSATAGLALSHVARVMMPRWRGLASAWVSLPLLSAACALALASGVSFGFTAFVGALAAIALLAAMCVAHRVLSMAAGLVARLLAGFSRTDFVSSGDQFVRDSGTGLSMSSAPATFKSAPPPPPFGGAPPPPLSPPSGGKRMKRTKEKEATEEVAPPKSLAPSGGLLGEIGGAGAGDRGDGGGEGEGELEEGASDMYGPAQHLMAGGFLEDDDAVAAKPAQQAPARPARLAACVADVKAEMKKLAFFDEGGNVIMFCGATLALAFSLLSNYLALLFQGVPWADVPGIDARVRQGDAYYECTRQYFAELGEVDSSSMVGTMELVLAGVSALLLGVVVVNQAVVAANATATATVPTPTPTANISMPPDPKPAPTLKWINTMRLRDVPSPQRALATLVSSCAMVAGSLVAYLSVFPH